MVHEADHGQPRSRSASGLAACVFVSPQDRLIAELEDKVAHLETDLLNARMRNAQLEEESVKLRNQISKLSREASDAQPAAAAADEGPMGGLIAMFSTKTVKKGSPAASPGGRARRGSV